MGDCISMQESCKATVTMAFLFLTLFFVICQSEHYIKTCNVTSYGAKGDGKTDNTKSIQSAINDCAKAASSDTDQSLVVLPAYYTNGVKAVYMSGALWLESNTDFYIDQGVTLLAIPCTNAS